MAAELETVFEQTQIGDEGLWSRGFDLSDDGLQTFAGDGAAGGGGEIVDGANDAGLRDAGGASAAATGRCSETHSVLQVENIRAMAERLQLGRERTHDGDDQTFFKIGINGAKAIDAQHHSSHIRSRVRSRATGWRLLSARV